MSASRSSLLYTVLMADSEDKRKLPPGVVPSAWARLKKPAKPFAPESSEPEAQATVIAGKEDLGAWRASLRPRMGGQGAETSTSGTETLKGRESARPKSVEAPFSRDVSATVAIPDLHTEARRKKAARVPLLPARTWVLLCVTVIVAAYIFLWDGAREPEDNSGIVSSSAEPSSVPVPSGKTGRASALSAPPKAKPAEIREPPSPKMQVASEVTAPQESEAMDPDVIEARAAGYWISGKFLQALPLYKQLSQQHPEHAGFSIMVEILRRQLVETCQAGEDPC